MSSTSSAAPSTTSFTDPGTTNQPSGGGGGPQNSPLLFFVALGFGVVFTNLWIIVGVKYCFRYNARNRARQHDENGEPIDLAAMPQRRRRREKKLMTMDEVNERFPITKYKTWVSTRAAQGLPTEGGVSQSRAASIKEAEGVIAPIDTTEGESATKKSTDLTETTREIPHAEASTPAATPANENALSTEPSTFATTSGALAEVKTVHSHAETTDEDDEAIPPAVAGASELLGAPGDSCAICIDTLEDNDDVRGLTCGHAFHASCLDPWLTNRRACCPLCKADYYTPKPRPDGTMPDDPTQQPVSDGTTPLGAQEITRPSVAAAPRGGLSRFMPRLAHGGDGLTPRRQQVQQTPPTDTAQSGNISFASMFRRGDASRQSQTQTTTPQPDSTTEQSGGRRWVPSIPNWRRGRQTEAASPGQLEAGNSTTA